MAFTEYMQLSPRQAGDPSSSANVKIPRQKKKVGFYYIMLDSVLGSGTFSKVYLAEMEPKELENRKKKNQFEANQENRFAIKEIANKTLRDKLGAKGEETL